MRLVSLTPPVANSTSVLYKNEPALTSNDEEIEAIGGTLYSVTSNDSKGFSNIDLSQETSDEES